MSRSDLHALGAVTQMQAKTLAVCAAVGLLLVSSGAVTAADASVKKMQYVGGLSTVTDPEFVLCSPADAVGIGGACFQVPSGMDTIKLRFDDAMCRNQDLFPFWPQDPGDDLPPRTPETVHEVLDLIPWPGPPIEQCGPGGYVFFQDANGQTLPPQVHFSCIQSLGPRDLPQSTDRVIVKFWNPGYNHAAPNCFGTHGEVTATFRG